MIKNKKIKRAIALSGGGPVAGIEIGALKAFEESEINFDIYSCA
jgi:predicted acylesterase/phospholipase RssA